jgi:hypothetical protein
MRAALFIAAHMDVLEIFPGMKAKTPKEPRDVWSVRLDRPMERMLRRWAERRGLTRKGDVLRSFLSEKLAGDADNRTRAA